MFALRKAPKLLLSSALVLALSACGGGGGGSNNTSNGSGTGTSVGGSNLTTPEGLYNGVKTAAVINENDALDAASLPISALDLIFLASLFVTDLPSFDQVAEGSDTILGEDGGSAEVTVSRSSGKVTVTIDFNAFNSGGLIFDGEVTQVSDAPNNYNTGTPYFTLDGSIDFKNAQLRTESATIQLNGSIGSDQNYGTDLSINLIAENLTDGSELYLEGFSASFEYAPRSSSFYGDLGDAITLRGKLYDSSLGMVDVTTEQPLRSYSFSEEDNIFAGGGISEIVVSGEQNKAKFVGLNRNFVSIILQDSDPDVGQKIQRVAWSEIYNELAVESLENMSAPIANLGSSFYAAVGTPTKIHGLFSHDDDRNFLDFQWRVVSVPAESNIADEIDLTQPILSFTPNLAGEYLFNLVVSDGIFSSKVSTKVLVKEDDFAPESAEPAAGAVEVTLAQDGTTNFTLNANSSAVNSSDNLYENATWYIDELYTDAESLIEGSTAVVTADPEVSWLIYSQLYAPTRTALSFVANSKVPDISVKIPLIKPEESSTYVERSLTKDLNGDGDLDLLQVVSGEVLIFLAKDGNYEFTQSVPTVENNYYNPDTYIEVGDIFSDGRLDLVMISDLGYFISSQNSDGLFSEREQLNVDLGCYEIDYRQNHTPQIGDYDGDGKADLIIDIECGADPENLYGMAVWLALATGELADPFYIPIKRAYVGEFTGDNRVDFVVPNVCLSPRCDDSELRVYENGTDGLELIYKFNNLNDNGDGAGIEIADINQDGLDDILHVNGRAFYVHRQLQSGGLTNDYSVVSENVYFGELGVDMALGDLDGNSESDLVIDAYGTTLVLLKNDNAYSLSYLGANEVEDVLETHVEVMDFDEDGQQDIVLYGGSMQVYYGGQKAFSTAVE